MKCRICKSNTKLLYISDLLPEYIWPSNKIIKKSKCNIFECQKCKILQLQNFSESKIKSFYGNKNFVILNKKKHKKRFDLIKKHYGIKFFYNKKILDIGGGVNPIANKKNVDIFDFKISKEVKKFHKGNIFKGDINKKYIPNKYSMLFLLHTLEHLKYPRKTLFNLHKMMLSNSKLFIEIPNFDFFVKNRPHYAVFHQHLNMFCLKSLENILSLANLQIEKVFLNNEVIFCAVTKSNSKLEKLNHNIDNKKKIEILKLKKQRVAKNLKNKFGSKKINLYGAGGSASLFFSNYNFLIKQLDKVFDNDINKIKSKFLGLKKINNKANNIQNDFSISSYKLNKKNNFTIT